MLAFLRIAPLLSAALLSACAVADHFEARVGRYDLTAAQSRDTMILTNIVAVAAPSR